MYSFLMVKPQNMVKYINTEHIEMLLTPLAM